MDWKPFWKIIEDAYRPDSIDHFEALKERLSDLEVVRGDRVPGAL